MDVTGAAGFGYDFGIDRNPDITGATGIGLTVFGHQIIALEELAPLALTVS